MIFVLVIQVSHFSEKKKYLYLGYFYLIMIGGILSRKALNINWTDFELGL